MPPSSEPSIEIFCFDCGDEGLIPFITATGEEMEVPCPACDGGRRY